MGGWTSHRSCMCMIITLCTSICLIFTNDLIHLMYICGSSILFTVYTQVIEIIIEYR